MPRVANASIDAKASTAKPNDVVAAAPNSAMPVD